MRKLRKLFPRLCGRQDGFTLVELLVVVSIIVALAAVSIVSVAQFSGKGTEGAKAAELDTVQAAMDAMMAAKGITGVTASVTLAAPSSNFATLPAGTGADALYGTTKYLRDNPTTYAYCWDISGKVVQQTANCP